MTQNTEKQLFSVMEQDQDHSFLKKNPQKNQYPENFQTMIEIPQAVEEESPTVLRRLKVKKPKRKAATSIIERRQIENPRIKRERRMDQHSKWSKKDDRSYWKFYIYYVVRKPHMFISWKTWKCENIFKQMSKYLGKNAKQCKSKDQNMKTNCEGQLDIIGRALIQLQQIKDSDGEAFQLLQAFYAKQKQQSWHMRMLKLRTQKNEENRVKLRNLCQELFSEL